MIGKRETMAAALFFEYCDSRVHMRVSKHRTETDYDEKHIHLSCSYHRNLIDKRKSDKEKK
jgi:hypothetical protein